MRNDAPNLDMLKLVAQGLGSLVEDVVFVGGCATGLLITDMAAPPTRETRDVDVIAEIRSHHDYHQLPQELRSRGFRKDNGPDAIMCCWRFDSVIVDVMPTEASILGFSNQWCSKAMKSSQRLHLPGGVEIRVVAPPLFLATKLEAFYGRGKGDLMASHDLEDIIAVLDGRSTIAEEVIGAEDVQQYLREEFSNLLSQRAFLDAIPCHLPADPISQQRAAVVLNRIREIAKL